MGSAAGDTREGNRRKVCRERLDEEGINPNAADVRQAVGPQADPWQAIAH